MWAGSMMDDNSHEKIPVGLKPYAGYPLLPAMSKHTLKFNMNFLHARRQCSWIIFVFAFGLSLTTVSCFSIHSRGAAAGDDMGSAVDDIVHLMFYNYPALRLPVTRSVFPVLAKFDDVFYSIQKRKNRGWSYERKKALQNNCETLANLIKNVIESLHYIMEPEELRAGLKMLAAEGFNITTSTQRLELACLVLYVTNHEEAWSVFPPGAMDEFYRNIALFAESVQILESATTLLDTDDMTADQWKAVKALFKLYSFMLKNNIIRDR